MTDLNDKETKYNLCNSGVHSYQVFTEIKNVLLDNPNHYEELYLETDLEIKRLIEEEELTEDEAIEQAEQEFYIKLELNDYIYAIGRDWNKKLAHRLDLLLCSNANANATTNRYIIDDSRNSCRLEAYQAIDRGTVDKDAILITNPEFFIGKLGVDIYNECIAAITKN